MRTYPLMPGVPAAGHVTARGGYWHPGRAEGCPKCEPYDPKPLCRCGHPVTTHDDGGCRRRCGCDRTQQEAREARKEVRR